MQWVAIPVHTLHLMKKLVFALIVAAAFTACSTMPVSTASQPADEARHSTPDKRPSMPDPSGVSPAGSAFHNNGL